MIATATWPSGKNETADAHAGGQGPPAEAEDHEPAHVVIAQMADLMRDTSGDTIADACILSAVSIGVAVETGLSAHVLRPGLAGALNLGLLCGLLACWLAAVVVLAWAGRPVVNRVSQLRWMTGAPLDPRPEWVTLPPEGARTTDWNWDGAYLLLGAARMASEYPAEFLGLGHELGRIAPGYRANLVLLDDEFKVQSTWIEGRRA